MSNYAHLSNEKLLELREGTQASHDHWVEILEVAERTVKDRAGLLHAIDAELKRREIKIERTEPVTG